MGVILGALYGLLIGAVTALLWRLTHDPAYPGAMIPDNNGWGRLVTFFATVIAGGCGIIVGLIVSLSGANKARGGMIGVTVGGIVFLLLLASSLSSLRHQSWREWQNFMTIHLLFLPIGLGLTGMLVSIVISQLKLK